MPAIQDAYSIHVSNRFTFNINETEQGYDSDTYVEIDPVEQLRLIQERKKQDRELKKKEKALQDAEKTKTEKKEAQIKETKTSNVTTKKHLDLLKEEKFKSKKESIKDYGKSAHGGDRQPPSEENRRSRRPNNSRYEKQPRDKGGDGDQSSGRLYDDVPDRSYKKGPGNADGEERTERGSGRYERYRGTRGTFRGSRGGSYGHRGNFRNDGRDDRGKREFDRRSGSDKAGVKPSSKRDGGGSRNWGTPGNEIEEAAEPSFDNEDSANWADQVENEEQNQEKPQNDSADEELKKEESDVVPEEANSTPVEMTLDEWKRLQNIDGKKKKFKLRQPGEGEDSDKWKGMRVIHESTVKHVHHHVVHDENLRKGPNKQAVDVNIRFDTPPRGGRGGRGGRGYRGGRGGFRGQRGGSGRYGNRYNSQAPPPDVLNEKEFPTLPAV